MGEGELIAELVEKGELLSVTGSAWAEKGEQGMQLGEIQRVNRESQQIYCSCHADTT